MIAGTYSSALTLGTIALPAPAGGRFDGFVAWINIGGSIAGTPGWALPVGDVSGQTAADQAVEAVACDAAGRVFLTGKFKTSVSVGTKTYVNAANNDFYVAKIDLGGVPQWLQPFGTAAGTYVYDVAVDSTGAPLVVGSTSSGANFGGGLMTNHGGYDGFLLKLDAAGGHQWSKLLGGDGGELFESVAFDMQDNALVTGETSGSTSLDLGGGALPLNGMLLAKFNASGGHVWSKGFTTAQEQINPTVRVKPGANDIYFAACNTDTLDLGTGPLGVAGNNVIALARFQP